MVNTLTQRKETNKRIQARFAAHKQLMAGLTKEIEQVIEAGIYDPDAMLMESSFCDLCRHAEFSLRQVAYMTTGKVELLSAKPQNFDGQTLSRIGEEDIHV